MTLSLSTSTMSLSSSIAKLLAECENEFIISRENGDNKRRLVKFLQDLASHPLDQIDNINQIECFLQSLWNCPILSEDCILVSGIIFAKLNPGIHYSDLCEKSQIVHHRNGDWVSAAIIRGILLSSQNSCEQLNELVNVTLKAIDVAILNNRTVLISRLLENVLQVYTAELKMNCYNSTHRGEQILSIVNRTLLLKSDLTDYKSRDLVKWHLNALQNNLNYQVEFAKNLLEYLPEVNKISIQIYYSLCCLNFQDSFIQNHIFELCLPCIK